MQEKGATNIKRPTKESFCEFDVFEKYKREAQTRKPRQRRNSPASDDLAEKIKAVAARNAEIELMYKSALSPSTNSTPVTLSNEIVSFLTDSVDEKSSPSPIQKVPHSHKHHKKRETSLSKESKELKSKRNEAIKDNFMDCDANKTVNVCQNCSGKIMCDKSKSSKTHSHKRESSKVKEKKSHGRSRSHEHSKIKAEDPKITETQSKKVITVYENPDLTDISESIVCKDFKAYIKKVTETKQKSTEIKQKVTENKQKVTESPKCSKKTNTEAPINISNVQSQTVNVIENVEQTVNVIENADQTVNVIENANQTNNKEFHRTLADHSKKVETEINKKPGKEVQTNAISAFYKKLETNFGNRLEADFGGKLDSNVNKKLLKSNIVKSPEAASSKKSEPDSKNKKLQSGINKKPESEINKKPESGINKKPESGTGKKHESGISKKHESGINKKPESGINKKPESGINKKPELGFNEKPQSAFNKPELAFNKPELASNNPESAFNKPESAFNKPELYSHSKPQSDFSEKTKSHWNKTPEPELHKTLDNVPVGSFETEFNQKLESSFGKKLKTYFDNNLDPDVKKLNHETQTDFKKKSVSVNVAPKDNIDTIEMLKTLVALYEKECEKNILLSQQQKRRSRSERRKHKSPSSPSKIHRKELSFSNLNLHPMTENYNVKQAILQVPSILLHDREMKETTTQTPTKPKRKKGEIFRQQKLEAETRLEPKPKPKLSQTALVLRDISEVMELERTKRNQPALKRQSNRMRGPRSPVYSDAVTKTEVEKAINRVTNNTKFHSSKIIVPNERVVEVASKVLKDQKISYTVEGVEPPQCFKTKAMITKKRCNLKTLLFPGRDITDGPLPRHGKIIVPNVSFPSLSSLDFNTKFDLLQHDKQNSMLSPRSRNTININKGILKKRNRNRIGLEVYHHKAIITPFKKETAKDLTNSSTQTLFHVNRVSKSEMLNKKDVSVGTNITFEQSNTYTTTESGTNFEVIGYTSTRVDSQDLQLTRSSKSENAIATGNHEVKKSRLKRKPSSGSTVDGSKHVQKDGSNSTVKRKSKSITNLKSTSQSDKSNINDVPLEAKSTSDQKEVVELETRLNLILEQLYNETGYVFRNNKLSKLNEIDATSRKALNTNLKEHKHIKKSERKCNNPKFSLESVYKNSKGFASSGTSLSSKLSVQVNQSTTYPISTPSLEIGFCNAILGATLKSSDSENARIMSNRKSVQRRRKRRKYMDSLKKKIKQQMSSSDFLDSVKIVSSIDSAVAVSSKKFKKANKRKSKNRFAKDIGIISKEPFFIKDVENPSLALDSKTIIDSLDALPYDNDPLCPLTSLFNYSPPTYAYHVYNTYTITGQPSQSKNTENSSNNNYTTFANVSSARNNASTTWQQMQAKPRKLTSWQKANPNTFTFDESNSSSTDLQSRDTSGFVSNFDSSFESNRQAVENRFKKVYESLGKIRFEPASTEKVTFSSFADCANMNKVAQQYNKTSFKETASVLDKNSVSHILDSAPQKESLPQHSRINGQQNKVASNSSYLNLNEIYANKAKSFVHSLSQQSSNASFLNQIDKIEFQRNLSKDDLSLSSSVSRSSISQQASARFYDATVLPLHFEKVNNFSTSNSIEYIVDPNDTTNMVSRYKKKIVQDLENIKYEEVQSSVGSSKIKAKLAQLKPMTFSTFSTPDKNAKHKSIKVRKKTSTHEETNKLQTFGGSALNMNKLKQRDSSHTSELEPPKVGRKIQLNEPVEIIGIKEASSSLINSTQLEPDVENKPTVSFLDMLEESELIEQANLNSQAVNATSAENEKKAESAALNSAHRFSVVRLFERFKHPFGKKCLPKPEEEPKEKPAKKSLWLTFTKKKEANRLTVKSLKHPGTCNIPNCKCQKGESGITCKKISSFISTDMKQKLLSGWEAKSIECDDDSPSYQELPKIDETKEIFNKSLKRYEKENDIATRLVGDAEYSREQLQEAQKESSTFLKSKNVTVIQDEGPKSDMVRSPRFNEKATPFNYQSDCVVEADDIGSCFARGFRPDNMLLSGEACFNLNKQDKMKMSPNMLKNVESIIDFSERETPLDFLLALGFMVDEASNALKDDDIRSRLLAAITEARVWINKITSTQGTLLYLVAYKSRPETMRYFLQLVEAIINKRITNAIKLDGFLRILEQVEDGRIQMISILGEDKFEDEENEEKIIKRQLKHLFVSVYNTAQNEAALKNKEFTNTQVNLLRQLVAKYRAGLHPHLELIARYIGQGLLNTDIQLEAAMIFLSRLDTTDVKLKEFENYCGIVCEFNEEEKISKKKFTKSTNID